ncbi:hypothetical protein TcasGA2_TC008591 [Tribolium castaneum]|uniref:Phospholipase A2-like domain-containing protein n=1 Tax=Tribolium castaneum TaxID=7070 RepID=D7EID9_TRICA|nr:hypothetical protein TcasGA2_TC008591 [Tribolium castaneum]
MLSFKGEGLLNTAINKLPFELHLPGYQYCGPGTKLKKRLERGDPGINKLDSFCKTHDIAYANSNDLKDRHQADRILEDSAWSRVKSKDASFGEKASAWFVTNAMKVKRKLGMGIQRKKSKRKTKKSRKRTQKKQQPFHKALLSNLENKGYDNIKSALSAARIAVRKSGGRKRIKIPRIIPIKTGGFLPLLPLIFGGLSALGAMGGGAAAITKAVNDAKAAKQKLDENKRHNKVLEDIAIGKAGSGLYLRKQPRGYGLYLRVESTLSEHYEPPIDLEENSNYSIALIGFYTNNNIPNIEEGTNKFYYFAPNTTEEKVITFPKGAYEIAAIEKYIQIILSGRSATDAQKQNTFSLKANENTLKCEIFSIYDINFAHEDSIGKLLGFSKRKLKARQLHESDLPVNIIKVNTIRIECNIVRGSFYKNKESHTLYETALSVSPAEQIFVEPLNPIYLPIINRSNIPNLTIDIVDQDHCPIDFNGQTINIRLALKKEA